MTVNHGRCFAGARVASVRLCIDGLSAVGRGCHVAVGARGAAVRRGCDAHAHVSAALVLCRWCAVCGHSACFGCCGAGRPSSAPPWSLWPPPLLMAVSAGLQRRGDGGGRRGRCRPLSHGGGGHRLVGRMHACAHACRACGVAAVFWAGRLSAAERRQRKRGHQCCDRPHGFLSHLPCQVCPAWLSTSRAARLRVSARRVRLASSGATSATARDRGCARGAASLSAVPPEVWCLLRLTLFDFALTRLWRGGGFLPLAMPSRGRLPLGGLMLFLPDAGFTRSSTELGAPSC